MTIMKLPTINFPIWIWVRNRSFRKTIEYIITFYCIITLNFFLPRLMPGDPFSFLSAAADEVSNAISDEQIAEYKKYYGLDQPVTKQYLNYISQVLTGNLGYSIFYKEAVLTLLCKRVGWTVGLVLVSLLFSCLLGVLLGCFSAWHRDDNIDRYLYFFMVSFAEIPAFLFGILFLFVAAGWLGLFPLSGASKPFAIYSTQIQQILDVIHHAALPVLTLVIARIGSFYMIARSSMLTVLTKDYMRTARAKGLSRLQLIFKHALKNAALPIVTRIFLSLGTVFSGAILVENVFRYPGIGYLLRESVMLRDYPLIQGIFLFFAVTVLSMNFFADLVYKKLDPRLE